VEEQVAARDLETLRRQRTFEQVAGLGTAKLADRLTRAAGCTGA